jgi:MoxR-like ATPase
MEPENLVIEELERLVEEVGALHIKLVLLTGETALSKTELVESLAERRNIRSLNTGLSLGRLIAPLSRKQRPLQSPAECHVRSRVLSRLRNPGLS